DEILRAKLARNTDPLSILWDKEDRTLPILREQPDDPDGENTLATALIHVGAQKVDWEVHDRASESPRFRLTDTSLVRLPGPGLQPGMYVALRCAGSWAAPFPGPPLERAVMGGPEALASPACHDRNKSDPVGGTRL